MQERTFAKSGHSERAVAGPLNTCISKFLDSQNRNSKQLVLWDTTVETRLTCEERILPFRDLSSSYLEISLLLFFSLDSGPHRELYLFILHDGRSTVCCFPDTGNNDFHQLAKV